MNYLFCSAGRRVELLKDFRKSINIQDRIIATDNQRYAPALQVADKRYLVPKITDVNYINILLNICKIENINAVFTMFDPEIELLAKNRELFVQMGVQIFVPDVKTAELCFDKYKMYKYLKVNEISTPLTFGSWDEFQTAYVEGEIQFPVFVKPRTGSGSVGARRVDTDGQLQKAFDADPTLIVQEYMCCDDIDVDIYIDAITHKTNALPWVLNHVRCMGLMAEVVSDEEYKLVSIVGYSDVCIVFNGPIKGKESFEHAIKNKATINIDSQRELEWLSGDSFDENDTVGLRVNIDLSASCSEDIEFPDDGFRFGFSYENGELEKALSFLKVNSKVRCVGLHFHCNSITRGLNVYRSIARKAVEIIRKYNLDLDYIDMGGGYFGGMPGRPTAYDYIALIRSELCEVVDPIKTKLIIEPGSAIIGSVVEFVTSVIDVKDTAKARIVTTDGSRINIDPLWKKKSYLYELETESCAVIGKQIVCGYTCMDHDRIMHLVDEPELGVGDRIIYKRVGAYSATLEGMFIRCHPDVYVTDSISIALVRKRMNIESYYKIQTC